MKNLGWKILGIFALIWLVWYWTGGPQRTTNVKPYLRYDYDTATINKSNTDLQTGIQEMLPVSATQEAGGVIGENLNKQDFSRGRNSVQVSQ